jgi:hypothetical protein
MEKDTEEELEGRMQSIVGLTGKGRSKQLRRVKERLRIFRQRFQSAPAKAAKPETPITEQPPEPSTSVENQPEAMETSTSISDQPSTSIETSPEQAQLSVITRIKAEAELFSPPPMQRNLAKAPRAIWSPRTKTAFGAREAEINTLKERGEQEESENQALRELAGVLVEQNRRLKGQNAVMKQRLEFQEQLLKTSMRLGEGIGELDEKQKALMEKLGLNGDGNGYVFEFS